MKNNNSWIRSLFGLKTTRQAKLPAQATAAPPTASNLSKIRSMNVRDTGPAIWKIGDIILSEYEVTGIVGEGGMGIVYKVYHRPWRMVMAVKSPRPEIFSRRGGKENFIHEAETWVNLSAYPHLVRCYAVHMLGGIPRVFAEYVEGGSLADWIRQRRLYAGGPDQVLERILDISIQFAWGLHFAHEQGLVHQDIKPANVMLTPEGLAKVTDFGLAKARIIAGEEQQVSDGKSGQSILVSSGGMTLAYCSPEQAAGQALSRKTDIWSWGLSVLEMFTGEVTWTIGIAAQEVLSDYEGLDPAIPKLPDDVINLLQKCFQPLPDDRPATMLEVAKELQLIYARTLGRSYSRIRPEPAAVQVSSLINQGYSLLQLGRPEEARIFYEKAIRLDPNSADAYYNLGGALQELGQLEGALDAYREAIRLKPDDVEAYNHQGNVLGQLGRSEEALLSFEQAIRLGPTYGSAYYNRGIVLEQLGRLQEALSSFEQAIRLDANFTTFAPIYLRKGLVLRASGKPAEALSAVEKAIKLDFTTADAHYMRGSLLREFGRLAEALISLEQAIRLNPKLALAYYQKGLALAASGRFKEALTAFEQTIRLDPTSVPAHFNRGNVLLELGQLKEALSAYEQTLRLSPDHARAWTNKGATLAKLGRLDEALVALEQASCLNPKDALTYMNKGSVLMQLGRRGEAMAALALAARLQS
ncbi:tetratricopeptide repeat protein [Tengunoibacter tsumagoiensis]|uniref:Protein kinase domain-containing protein n=1 Tax=Tengunoibacter tsumagoiensis TaxID=2014871 RepID=A0A402A5W1_9CHLR|nr:serine/threonine-protein kinase [Tengunoibacter tsumagoiensis]GCE14502.1 hypothetical protein KTT_43610 [Tengunoibacter tsumagoiensis]